MSGTAPSTFRIYLRAPRLLASERGRAALPAAAGIAVALMQLAGPVLFGRGIDAPAQGRGAFGVIALWAELGLLGIAASVPVAVASDRLAHRRRLAAPAEAFARAITPSVSYHWERGTGAVVRAILAGTDTLFGQWPSFLRHQLTAVVAIMFLIPTAIGMDPRMASILAVLALLHLGINVLVVRRTSAGQEAVERHHGGVYGRVGDVPGNVTVVRSYVRGSAELEATRAVIGARGAALSGGERQRLAIARAILKDAPILILDEATSALDAETEAKIKRALDASRRGRTTLIIAHRLSTVADADRILVMERGTFREPATGGGLLARLGAEGGFTEPTAPGGA